MKTICFDLRALQTGHENRGIGAYIKGLLENLPVSEDKYVFYAFDRNNPLDTLGIRFTNPYELVQTPTIKTALGSPRDILGLVKLINHRFDRLRSLRPNVFVQFDFTLGAPRWKNIETVMIGYDLIPLIIKNEYLPSISFAVKHSATRRGKTPLGVLRSLLFRITHASFKFKRSSFVPKTLIAVIRSMYYTLKYRLHYKTYQRADRIICISKTTADDFVNILGIDKAKISSIPLAAVLADAPPDDSISKKITKPFVFYIGGTDSRKRIQDIIHAFNIARGRGADIDLVLAGNEFSKLKHLPCVEGRNAILRSPYKDDIHLVGFVSDEQKMALYQSAHAFVFCTIYEGFGLPILEAMSAGCPVISYDNSSIPETAGNAAILVKTGDYVTIAKQILRLCDDNGLRQELANRGINQAKKFTWDKYATKFLKAIR